ncbi:VanZ family protein [Clostridium sp. Marseille-P2415]|uniref:VanZ family protein n=1 Tax=Clostridium sp. Marseille-P2415 TaxID=1805471 RepID=UPI0009885B80|nr:VanZ family protein [Clostridium sp. Marseille-P2415]
MKKKYIWTAVTVLYVLFVFSNSMKPATVSSADSGKVLSLAREFLAASGISIQWLTEHIIRKTGHFSEYTLFGVLLSGCILSHGIGGERRWFIHLTAGYMVPFVDETIQLFVNGRSGQISDVWLDCSGVAFGTLIVAVIMLTKKRMEKLYDKKLPDGTGI